MSHITQPPTRTNQETLENVLTQQEELHPCHTADTTNPSLASSSHQSYMLEEKGKQVAYPSNLNTELQIFNWNS